MVYDKRILLGSLFLIMSGAVYEVEKVLSYFKWAVETIPVLNRGSGGYSPNPGQISLSDNFYVLLFFAIGFCFFISAFWPYIEKRMKKKAN